MINRQLYQLIIVHFKEIIREPGVLFWGIGFPILLAWGLGLAFTQKHEINHNIAIVQDGINNALPGFISQGSEITYDKNMDIDKYTLTYKDSVLGKTYFHFYTTNWDEAIKMIKRGKVNLIIETNKEGIKYHFDPMNPEAQGIFFQLENLQKEGDMSIVSKASIDVLDLQGTRYIDFLIPGLIAMGIMSSIFWGMGYTIIERRKGNMLRRMIVTPMKKSNLLVALMTARISMNIVEAGLLVIFALLYFGTVLQGSIPGFILVFLAGNIAFAGIAILISSRTSKTEIGNGIINVVTIPMMILSGIFFSYQNFPDWAIPFIKVLPLTMLTDSIRSLFNEGAGLADVLIPTLVLSSIGIVSFIAGIKIFKWY
ncbi:MAG: ABC transporter permease [Bacteroidota bacterium]